MAYIYMRLIKKGLIGNEDVPEKYLDEVLVLVANEEGADNT